MKIAVGIPVFNDSVFLKRSVQNCLDVGYDNVVYYDDGSTDDTYDKLMDLTKGHDHIIVLRENENSINSRKINRWELVSKKCQELSPDWIMVRAADECLSYPAFRDGPNLLRSRLKYLLTTSFNMVVFQYIDLWRSTTWFRSDGFWERRTSVNCWRNDVDWQFKYRKGSIHIGGHLPNKMSVPQKQCGINKRGQDIVVLHYGMSSNELLERKLRYQIETSKAIGSRAHGIPKGIPSPKMWHRLNGYKIGHEFDIRLEKVHQLWFKDEINHGPAPRIKSLGPLIAEYDPSRALAYERLHNRVFNVGPSIKCESNHTKIIETYIGDKK